MLGQTFRSLQESFIAERGAHADDLALIRWETARLWGRIGRAAPRSGAIGLGDAIAARPDHLGLGYARAAEIVLSRLLGGARGLRRAGLIGRAPGRARVWQTGSISVGSVSLQNIAAMTRHAYR